MFKWLKRLMGGTQDAEPRSPPTAFETGTLIPTTVWDVVDQFLTRNGQRTPFGVHALVDAGATNLLEPEELLEVCEKIQEHGYQYPLNPTLMAELDRAELLSFLRWHAENEIEKTQYENEVRIRGLIEQFRYAR